ncbi:MAG: dephospho-CoA kinase [Longimicrobiales bacterium]
MYRVGLTGNIASGKSTVAQEWSRLGAHVIDADVLARRAVAPGTDALHRIGEVFGNAMIVNGSLDRAALGRIVFRDPGKRRVLETIVHPEVRRLREEEEARAAARGERIVVHAVPLLYETGMEGQFDTVVLVDAAESVRLERLVAARELSADDARAMIAAQQPSETKRVRADHVIENNGTLDQLVEQARAVWARITAAA